MHLWELILLVLVLGLVWAVVQALANPPPSSSSGSTWKSIGSGVRDMVRGGRELLQQPTLKHSIALLGTTYAVPWLIDRCRQCNPLLTESQLKQLYLMLGNACTECFRANGPPIARLVRPIIALAVPDGEAAYEMLTAFLAAVSVATTGNNNNSRKNDIDDNLDAKGELGSVLCDKFGCLPVAVRQMKDKGVQRALQQLLCAKPGPTCPITLEELLSPSGRLDRGVAMIVQRPPLAATMADEPGKTIPHVYLFRREALERWFAESRSPTNPLTRQSLDRSRDYLVIS
jgi:hypothetical protein